MNIAHIAPLDEARCGEHSTAWVPILRAPTMLLLQAGVSAYNGVRLVPHSSRVVMMSDAPAAVAEPPPAAAPAPAPAPAPPAPKPAAKVVEEPEEPAGPAKCAARPEP